MPALRNRRYEVFAVHMAEGKTQAQAAQLAGFSPLRAPSQGCHLAKRPEVAARIEEIKAAMAAQVILHSGIDKAYIMQGLDENFRRAMQAEPVRDSDGNITGEYTYQGAVANRALELMGKELGMFTDRVELSASEDMIARLQAARARVFDVAPARIEAAE